MRIIREIDLLRRDSLRGHVQIILNWVLDHQDIKANEEADCMNKAVRDDLTWSILPPDVMLKISMSTLKREIRKRNTAPLRVCAHLLDDCYSVRITKARGRHSFKESPKVLDKHPRLARILATQLVQDVLQSSKPIVTDSKYHIHRNV